MHIEWQRRLQLISPDLLADSKPTSDTAFSFLNGAQDRYVIANYIGDDQTLMDTHSFNRNVDAIKSLLIKKELEPSGTTVDGLVRFELPTEPTQDYFLYVASSSRVTGTYKQLNGTKLITNSLIKYKDLDRYIATAFNNPIIRVPGAILMADENTGVKHIAIAVDAYTQVDSMILTYYRKPLRFNSIPGENVVDKCELPESEHSTIVDMAVEMFITEAKYRLQTKQADNNA